MQSVTLRSSFVGAGIARLTGAAPADNRQVIASLCKFVKAVNGLMSQIYVLATAEGTEWGAMSGHGLCMPETKWLPVW